MVVALTERSFRTHPLGPILRVTQIGLVGGILGPLVGSFIFDVTGGYTLAFLFCGSTFLLAGFTILASKHVPLLPRPATPRSVILFGGVNGFLA